MTYPLSSEVTAGQPTLADHYNNLRKDALQLGNAAADSLTLAGFLNRYNEFVTLEYLDTNRLRVPYSTGQPPTLMINGCMLQATANVDLPSNQFSGSSATWYVFAVRTAGSTTFTLSVNTSATETANQRLIGEVTWDGGDIIVVKSYFSPAVVIPDADYDSGWFAVTTSTTYTKAHSIGQVPRFVQLYWCSTSNGAGGIYPVTCVYTASPTSNTVSPLYMDATNVYAITGTASGTGTLMSTNVRSGSGYYRIMAWK